MPFEVEIIEEPSNCVLCLHSRDGMLTITSVAELDIVAILCRHFWFTPETIRYQSVCKSCWNSVEKFHRFYQQVERAYSLDFGARTVVNGKCYIVLDASPTPAADGGDVPKLDCEWTFETTEEGLEHDAQNEEYVVRTRASCDSQILSERNHESLKEHNDVVDESTEQLLPQDFEEGDRIISDHCQLQCITCGLKSPTFIALMKHFRSAHKARGHVECCGRKFSKRRCLLEHVSEHYNRSAFRCDVCNKRFSSSLALNKHTEKHDQRETETFKCETCGRSFVKRYLLNAHRKQHAANNDKNIPCSVCQKTFLNEKRLDEHMKRIHGQDEFICERCPQRFNTYAKFRAHNKSGHDSNGTSRQECKVCNRWLKNAASLRKHMYRHRSSSKPNVCDICGKNAPNAMALQSHKLFVHQKEKSYKCNVCHKAFKRGYTLQEHMTIHTRTVLYSCPYCSKTSNSSANLHAHKKKAHPKEWEQNRKEYEQRFKCKTDIVPIIDE